jgi:hypothetical protein
MHKKLKVGEKPNTKIKLQDGNVDKSYFKE